MSAGKVAAPLKVEFVSDLTCPWCAIALAGLEQALERLRPALAVDLRIEPFELNPDLPAEGEDIARYAARKYGASEEQLTERQALIRACAEDAGLRFVERTRIWNTFDAHRLLQWARRQGRALELKRALLAAYHVRGQNPGSREVLLDAAAAAELDGERAQAILAGGEYAAEVRARVRVWMMRGLASVPSVVMANRFLIQGGQPAVVYEEALRRVADAPGNAAVIAA